MRIQASLFSTKFKLCFNSLGNQFTGQKYMLANTEMLCAIFSFITSYTSILLLKAHIAEEEASSHFHHFLRMPLKFNCKFHI